VNFITWYTMIHVHTREAREKKSARNTCEPEKGNLAFARLRCNLQSDYFRAISYAILETFHSFLNRWRSMSDWDQSRSRRWFFRCIRRHTHTTHPPHTHTHTHTHIHHTHTHTHAQNFMFITYRFLIWEMAYEKLFFVNADVYLWNVLSIL